MKILTAHFSYKICIHKHIVQPINLIYIDNILQYRPRVHEKKTRFAFFDGKCDVPGTKVKDLLLTCYFPSGKKGNVRHFQHKIYLYKHTVIFQLLN